MIGLMPKRAISVFRYHHAERFGELYGAGLRLLRADDHFDAGIAGDADGTFAGPHTIEVGRHDQRAGAATIGRQRAVKGFHMIGDDHGAQAGGVVDVLDVDQNGLEAAAMAAGRGERLDDRLGVIG